jgi:hypothetical protein
MFDVRSPIRKGREPTILCVPAGQGAVGLTAFISQIAGKYQSEKLLIVAVQTPAG